MTETQNSSRTKSRNVFIRVLRLILFLLLWPLKFAWIGIRWILFFLYWGLKKIGSGLIIFFRWFGNGTLLFIYSSRRLFTLGTIFAVILALYLWIFLGWRSEGDLLGILFIPALALSVLFSMNVLPREREGHTMEIFFSLPVNRYRLVIWHLVTIALWLFILLLIPVLLLAPLRSELHPGQLLLRIYPSLICISCLTLWISTYTRNGPAAGFVAGLICFLQLFQVRSFGPIQLFQSPYLSGAWGTGNIILLAFLTLFLLVLTNERLKRSELWFR